MFSSKWVELCEDLYSYPSLALSRKTWTNYWQSRFIDSNTYISETLRQYSAHLNALHISFITLSVPKRDWSWEKEADQSFWGCNLCLWRMVMPVFRFHIISFADSLRNWALWSLLLFGFTYVSNDVHPVSPVAYWLLRTLLIILDQTKYLLK